MADLDASLYCNVTKHLEQGDIFSADFVTPIASAVQRVFRSSSGQHGQVVFGGKEAGKVFSRRELEAKLASIPDAQRTKTHTAPFSTTEDGHPELVVTHAHLRKYFVIATQTCDISGLDKIAYPLAIVLPVQTIQDICLQELPFIPDGTCTSIHEFLRTAIPNFSLSMTSSPYKYGEEIMEAVENWAPKTQELRQNRNVIKKALNAVRKPKGSVHYLPGDSEFDMPESIIDFTSAYTVTRESLLRMAGKRVARINSPWREQFAQNFANFFGRVATPATSRPKELK